MSTLNTGLRMQENWDRDLGSHTIQPREYRLWTAAIMTLEWKQEQSIRQKRHPNTILCNLTTNFLSV
jgi:hypothetical protein